MYTQVAEKWLADQPSLTPLQREFLEKALAFYQTFAAEEGSDPQVRHGAARALHRVGVIRQKLGQHAEAETALRQAVEQDGDLARRHPDRPEFRFGLAESQIELSRVYYRLGRCKEEEQALRTGDRRAHEAEDRLPRRRRVSSDNGQGPDLAGNSPDGGTSAPGGRDRRSSDRELQESLVKEFPDVTSTASALRLTIT